MAYTEIELTVSGSTATITLDRPERLNAYTVTMFKEIMDAFDRTDANDSVRAVVITGRGRGFCSGADLGAGASTFDGHAKADGSARRDSGGVMAIRIFDSRKPVIAAINGPAVGVGLTMTLPCDVRLVATGAKLGFPFAGRGIVPDGASSWFLPRVVGVSKAVEWCLTARTFLPDEALAAGLVRSIHEPDELLDVAYALADEMAAGSAPVSAAITRRLMWSSLGFPHPVIPHAVESRAIADLGGSPDAAEGVTAFLQKRRPEWTMRPSTDTPDWFPPWSDPDYTPA